MSSLRFGQSMAHLAAIVFLVTCNSSVLRASFDVESHENRVVIWQNLLECQLNLPTSHRRSLTNIFAPKIFCRHFVLLVGFCIISIWFFLGRHLLWIIGFGFRKMITCFFQGHTVSNVSVARWMWEMNKFRKKSHGQRDDKCYKYVWLLLVLLRNYNCPVHHFRINAWASFKRNRHFALWCVWTCSIISVKIQCNWMYLVCVAWAAVALPWIHAKVLIFN